MTTIEGILDELVPGYLAARRAEIPQMMALLAASDFERLRILSHSLKGSGSSFGFPELTHFGAALEAHAQSFDLISYRDELQRLKDYLEHLPSGSARPWRKSE